MGCQIGRLAIGGTQRGPTRAADRHRPWLPAAEWSRSARQTRPSTASTRTAPPPPPAYFGSKQEAGSRSRCSCRRSRSPSVWPRVAMSKCCAPSVRCFNRTGGRRGRRYLQTDRTNPLLPVPVVVRVEDNPVLDHVDVVEAVEQPLAVLEEADVEAAEVETPLLPLRARLAGPHAAPA